MKLYAADQELNLINRNVCFERGKPNNYINIFVLIESIEKYKCVTIERQKPTKKIFAKLN